MLWRTCSQSWVLSGEEEVVASLHFDGKSSYFVIGLDGTDDFHEEHQKYRIEFKKYGSQAVLVKTRSRNARVPRSSPVRFSLVCVVLFEKRPSPLS